MVETLTLSLDEVSLTDGDNEQHNMVFTSLRNLLPKGRNKSKQIAEEEIFALHFHNQEQPATVGRTIKFWEKISRVSIKVMYCVSIFNLIENYNLIKYGLLDFVKF